MKRVRYQIARRLRGIVRFALFHLVRSDYHPYSETNVAAGWQGCYEWRYHCLAFRDKADNLFYSW